MFVDELAKWVLRKIFELNADLSIKDYCVCLKYSYVEVSGEKGDALGLALTPVEDIFGTRVGLQHPHPSAGLKAWSRLPILLRRLLVLRWLMLCLDI